LWRERAFLFEQLREQYLDRGRACSLHSGHAHIVPEPPDTAALAAGLAGFDAALGGAGGGLFSGAADPTRSATVGLGTTRARGFTFRRGCGTMGVTPSSGDGRSFIAGRLFGQSQHFSMDQGNGDAGKCRPQYQCS